MRARFMIAIFLMLSLAGLYGEPPPKNALALERPKAWNQLVIERAPSLKILRNWGYRLRLKLGLISDWLLVVEDPKQSGFKQILLREEIAEEFINPAMFEFRRRRLDQMIETARRLEKNYNTEVAVLIVPTKIAANQIETDFKDINSPAFEMFGDQSGLKKIGGFETQRQIESYLGERNVRILSPLKRYESEQLQKIPLYPRGESHWDQKLMVSVAKWIVSELKGQNLIEEGCVDQAQKIKPFGTKGYFGDLFGILGLEPNDDSSKEYKTEVEEYTLGEKSKGQPNCRNIILAGTSYGEIKYQGHDLTDLIGALYKGNVVNRSRSSETPVNVLKRLEEDFPKAKDEKGKSLILWEAPLRRIKDIPEP